MHYFVKSNNRDNSTSGSKEKNKKNKKLNSSIGRKKRVWFESKITIFKIK
jgi:hypothetical protein